MNNDLKVFIVGIDEINKRDIAEAIIKYDDNYSVCPMFTSDINKKDLHSPNKYYIDNDSVSLAFKNNALLYVTTNEVYSEGVTFDDMYNSDIVYMTIREFNTISENFLNTFNVLIIWVDTKKHSNKLINSELFEIKYFQNYLDKGNHKYMYFLDELPDDIAKTICEYLSGDEETQQHLLEENS